MKKANEFDPVFDTQSVFRKLLEAFSNPGRVVDISESAKRMNSAFGAYLAVAAALIDNETSYCVMGDPKLSAFVRQLTYGRPESPDQSNFLFVLAGMNADEIRSILEIAPVGTPEEPHRSGIAFVRVESFDPKPGCAIRGPGVKDVQAAPLSVYAKAWLKLRGEIGYEYPCGLDLAFITDAGQIVAAPRLIQLAG